MKLASHLARLARVSPCLVAVLAAGSLGQAAEKPAGRFLFQPMLIWGTAEVTQQGTGFLVRDGQRYYGATSIHFMNFEARGLFEAIWLDIHTSKPMIGFRTSLGKPDRTSIERRPDIQYDFVLMPMEELPAGCAAVELENVEKYAEGTRLWFPNKSGAAKIGYEWLEAVVVEDEGRLLNVRFVSAPKLQSQSGTPFLNQESGRVVGLLMGGDEKMGIFLCPARSLVARIKSQPKEMPLMESITK